MKIIVPIKQVPETKAVKMDEKTGTVIREGVESIINPLDLYAIETAIQLKESRKNSDDEIVAITMGPPKAIDAVKEAVAMGCDSAVMISDKAFAGSDTWATSYVLAEAIKRIGDYSLVICGERATDGDTGQVGPGIAAFLGLPVTSYVNKVNGFGDNDSICDIHRLIEDGSECLKMELPGVLTVVKEVGEPRLPTLRGKLRAKKCEIPTWNCEFLGIDIAKVGLKGSPTRVVKIFRPKVARECEKITAADEDEANTASNRLVEFLQGKELI